MIPHGPLCTRALFAAPAARGFRFGGPTSLGLLALLVGCLTVGIAQAEPVTVGFRTFHYGDSVTSTPTGEKPESKLWWNDSDWWGCLWDTTSLRYEIHRFDPRAQYWESTNTPVDDRHSTKSDVMWDGQHLYVASHIFTTLAGPAVPANAARLYRFSYHPLNHTYTLDPGFPVLINASKSETLILDKDSTGRLWITWVEAGKVWVNRTLGSDLTWGQPFALPVQGSDVSVDDISALVPFGGSKVGLMWSNQNDRKTYFSVHHDANADETWEPREIALSDTSNALLSDDHISIKAHEGIIYAATKTGAVDPSDPLVYVLRRDLAGVWSRHVFGRKSEDHTRPVLLIDTDRDLIHVIASTKALGRQLIYMKSASIADLVFPEGFGTLFLDSPNELKLGNPSSTKQSLTALTGLLAIACDQDTRYYLHNYFFWLANTGVSDATLGGLTLDHGRPNPFRSATRIHFQLPSAGRASLAIYDMGGRLVRRLVAGTLPAGSHTLEWDGQGESGTPLGSGTYLARLVAGRVVVTQKLTLLR